MMSHADNYGRHRDHKLSTLARPYFCSSSNSSDMKPILLVTAIILSSLCSFGQEPSDALRYSWYIQGGTARQQAIGGAMGSFGGEISRKVVNPTHIAFFWSHHFLVFFGTIISANKV